MQKRLLILLTCLLIHTFGLTQSRLAYSIDFGPIYSYRDYTITDYSMETDVYPSGKEWFNVFEDYYNEVEKYGLGFGLTLGISYNLFKTLDLKTGLGYKKIEEKIVPSTPVESIPINGKINMPNYSNCYHYLTFPLNVQHKVFSIDKFSFGVVLGSDIDFLISYTMTSRSNKFLTDPKYEAGQVSKLSLNLRGGLIINYKMRRNLSIYLQPDFARYITPNLTYDLGDVGAIYFKADQYNYYIQTRFGINFH